MKNFFLTLLLFFSATCFCSQSLYAVELPIRKHLNDAIKLNQKRMFQYAKLTNGESYLISTKLILMEELALIATINLDLEAHYFIKNGVNLFKDDLIDMALTPDFRSEYSNTRAPIHHTTIDIKKISSRWLQLIKNDKLNEIYDEAFQLLEYGLLNEKNQNCLSRHFVESIARSLYNLKKHQEMAKKLNLKDPKGLALKFIKIQIRSLSYAYSLDKKAFPIQKNNIPILCQDVPPIAYN